MATLQALADSRAAGKQGKIQLLSSTHSQSLHGLVVDSYRRTKTKVPSLLSSFLPKLHVFCPQVSASLVSQELPWLLTYFDCQLLLLPLRP